MRIRKAARLLILNDQNQLLLSNYQGVMVREPGHEPLGSYWETIGGGIDDGESLQQAAMREAYEEAGLGNDDVELGPVVWHGQNNLIDSNGERLIADHSYILAKTKRHIDATKITPMALTEDELGFLKEFRWWTMEELRETQENIVPPIIERELSKIINGQIPPTPLELKLSFA